MKNPIKNLTLAIALVATPLIADPPPKYIDVDANYQQSQDLDDLNIQQGASMRIRLRHRVDGAWPTLTGNTARWEARQQLTNTSAYTATSNLTSNEAHWIQFDLNNVQTGTSLTNWFYSIILVDGGEDYPIGVGTLNVIASDFAGSSGVLVGSGYETNSVDVTASVSTINFSTGITAVHDGTNKLTLTVASSAGGDLTEVQVSGSILTVASGTGPIPIVGLTTAAVQAAQITYTAATNLILSGTEFSLDGSGVASLALADSALQSYTETDPIAILPDGTRSMTADLQIGTNKVQDVTGIHFVPTNSAVSSVEGNVYWDETDITLALRSDIADAIMQVGQEFWMRAKKDAGETISNGDAVYISGASGERPKVARADSVTNSHVVGLATHTWTSNDGWVTMEGLVRDLDTSSYSDGDELFVSATPGGLTNVSQFVGQGSVATVTRSHASAGHVFVAIVHSELEPAWNAVSNTVTANALLGSTALPLAGGTMTGNISMGGLYSLTDINNIILTGSGTPTISNSGELALTAWMATIDATTGNQIVGWSVLTNQIALLAPAGGGVTPAFTNVSSLSYNVADLSGIDVNQGLVWNSESGSFTNSSGTLLVAPASVSAINATTWSVVYSDGSTTGNLKSLALPTAGKVLTGNGVSAAPTWETPSAGGGSQTPWTNNVDAAGFALTDLDYTTMRTNAAAVTGVAAKLVQYILNDRLYSVYDSVTNYAVLN